MFITLRIYGFERKKGVKVGALADIVVMKRTDDGLCVLETYKKGILVYKRTP